MPIEITATEEKAIIALALDEPVFFGSLIEEIGPDFFALDEARYVFKVIKWCYDENGDIPSRELVRDWVEKSLHNDRENWREIVEICDHKINPRDYDAIKDRFIKWLRSRTLNEVYQDNIIEAAKAGNYTELEKIIDRAARLQDLSGDYMWFFDDINKLFDENIEVKYTTGFSELDQHINEGGPTKGDVLVWMAPTGTGKCHSLQSRIIVEKLSAIYELELDDGTKIKLAGFRRIKTSNGVIKVCDLAEGDDIVEIPSKEDSGDISL